MAFEAILNKVRQAKQNLKDNRRAKCLKIAFDQIALAKYRVQTKGLDSEERPFAPYTTAYGKERKSKGYQIGYVDFTRTGRFFASIEPVIVAETDYSITIQIKSRDERGNKIIAGASPKRLNPTLPSKPEIELSRQANKTRVFDDIRAAFGIT